MKQSCFSVSISVTHGACNVLFSNWYMMTGGRAVSSAQTVASSVTHSCELSFNATPTFLRSH
jgi:hypothetical protein